MPDPTTDVEFQGTVTEEFKTADPFFSKSELAGFAARSGNETSADLQNRFTYHPPKPGQQERYVAIRDKALELAALITTSAPYSPEQTFAVRKVEEAVMWANSAIARNE